MSLLTSGGKSLGIGSDCTIDDKAYSIRQFMNLATNMTVLGGAGAFVAFQRVLCMG